MKKNLNFKFLKFVETLLADIIERFFIKKYDHFIKHNKKTFNFSKLNTNRNILMEFHNWSSLHIASSYLLKSLQKKYNANITAYAGYPLIIRPLKRNLLERIKWHVGIFFSIKFFGVYKSIGASEFIYPEINKDQKRKAKIKFLLLLKKIHNNKDIENISIKNVVIGDLIYDSFLKMNSLGTIDINSENFKKFLIESIQLFYFWDDYFNKHNIKAVVISHSVYFLGMFARIALKKNIKVYVCHPDYINCLNKKIPYARAEFLNFKLILKNIDKKLLKIGLKYTKKKISDHIAGKKDDIWWTKKSTFSEKKKFRVLNNNNKFKYLIASHSFEDSPHAFGNNLFPDNYLWLDFIGKNTINSKHEYYIKPHPALHSFEQQNNKKILNKIIKKYPHLILLPENVGHFQLMKEGIKCVLTVIGTIGFEYPLFNIPVINASKKSSTYKFNFNIHVDNINYYKSLILEPKKIKLKINQNEILKYYFLRHIYHPRNWLFKNIQYAEKKYGGYNEKIYNYWIQNEYSVKRDEKIFNNLNKFINSNDYILDYKYSDRDILEDMKAKH